MKTRILRNALLAVAAITTMSFPAGRVAAQEPTSVAPPAVVSQPAPELSYGVPQVLQLVQAKVSDGVVVNYIQNSGTIYALKAEEIVYLKQQGMSDTVLNAMLNQRARLTASSQPATTTAPSATASYSPAAPSSQPVATYTPSAQSSTVYVIPDTQTYRYNAWYYGATPYYYYPYPYYGGYYSGWPALSLSFAWGSGYGGYHGNYYHGGGYGGGWHGGGGGHPPGGGGGHGGGGPH